MKFTVTLLLLAAASQASETSTRQQKVEGNSKTDKRALVEGNVGVEKRTPVLAAALPSVTPGIEYADSKDFQSDKSQNVYATPVPQLAKISDVLTGQGPPFQAAIASHLFSPVSLYQSRLASPTYEVSAPVPSQLAYTEKITYQPQTPEQLTPQVYRTKQPNRLTYQPLQYQQPLQSLQPQQPQLQQAQYQQAQVLQIPFQGFYSPQPIQYQNPIQFSNQPINFVQQQQLPTAPGHAGIVYAKQEDNPTPIAKELKQSDEQPKREQLQNYNTQNQGAVSFASYSVGPSAVSLPQPKQQPYQPQLSQPQPIQAQYQIPQPQFNYHNQQQQQQQIIQQQLQQYHIHRIPQNLQYQHFQYQSPHRQQIQPQIIQKLEPSPANSIAVPSKLPTNPGKQVYIQPGYVIQPQAHESQDAVFQNPYGGQPLAVPTFPPVQFFGKYAQSIFKNYQQ